MSDFGNYYGSFQAAKEWDEKGDLLRAAIEYFMCMQYYHHGEFPMAPDYSLLKEAKEKYHWYKNGFVNAPLSKSTYIKGCQCLKALWLHKNKYNEHHVSKELQEKFNRGHNIGALAQKLFPDGEDASWMEGKDEALKNLQKRSPINVPKLSFTLRQALWLKRTEELVAKNESCIFEAAFICKCVFAAVDILDMNGGHPIAYEVKSTTELKDVYIKDCALQYMVINHYVPLDDMVLIYIDGDYLESLGKPLSELTEENCDIHKLFKMQSILEEVKAMQPMVEANIERLLPMTWETEEPKVAMGEQCTKPYECEFKLYCNRCAKMEKPSFFKRLFGKK